MRLHARPDHPDYRPDIGEYNVRLDGAVINHCVFADEENGVVEIYLCDTKGNPLTDNANTIVTEIKRGRVELIRREDVFS